MGSWGSGTWTRWNRKKTVEECRFIETRKLIDEGFIGPDDRIFIADDFKIRLRKIPPHNSRIAFVCPECEGSVLKLYVVGHSLACRVCQNLTYRSCQDSSEKSARYVWRLILSRVGVIN